MTHLFKGENTSAHINRYVLWALISIELLMSFSAFGYIHMEPISITLVYIPVLLAGCLLGAREAALVGVVFGLSSMWKASAFYVEGGDVFFSPVMSGKPVQSILLSVGARSLFGFAAGLLYQAAKRSRHPLAGIILVTSIGRLLHSIFVYAFLEILFPESGLGVANALDGVSNGGFLPFLLTQEACVLFCYAAYHSRQAEKLAGRIQAVDGVELHIAHNKGRLFLILALAFIASISVAWYFINRISSVMSRYGVQLTDHFSYHLQLQFLLGIISLFSLILLVVVLYKKNFNYTYYEAKMDDLTELPGRGQFFLTGRKLLEKLKFVQDNKNGYFVILDIDYFKEINDQYGHPSGDRVLVNVARSLKNEFGNKGVIGRLGGDEFVAFISYLMSESEMRSLVNDLKEKVEQIELDDGNVTCSIGVVTARENCTIEELYRDADRLLYEAKKNGKNQFVFR